MQNIIGILTLIGMIGICILSQYTKDFHLSITVCFLLNSGIVPQFCDKLFQGIEENQASGVDAQYEVSGYC